MGEDGWELLDQDFEVCYAPYDETDTSVTRAFINRAKALAAAEVEAYKQELRDFLNHHERIDLAEALTDPTEYHRGRYDALCTVHTEIGVADDD